MQGLPLISAVLVYLCVFIRFYAVFKPYNKLFICQMIFFIYEYHSGYAKI